MIQMTRGNKSFRIFVNYILFCKQKKKLLNFEKLRWN